MKIKPAVRTEKEIDICVSAISGTWVKRRNARIKLVRWSNDLVEECIAIQRSKIRTLKSNGVKEGDLRLRYAEITRLEMMRL